ncbi:MAG: hypothetical protein ABR552_01255 [Actinomycetota bacterium]
MIFVIVIILLAAAAVVVLDAESRTKHAHPPAPTPRTLAEEPRIDEPLADEPALVVATALATDIMPSPIRSDIVGVRRLSPDPDRFLQSEELVDISPDTRKRAMRRLALALVATAVVGVFVLLFIGRIIGSYFTHFSG